MPTPPAIQWPVCTVYGCGHTITHANEAALTIAVRENDHWVISPSGIAVCVCHGYSPIALYHPFPCDQRGQVPA
jgi:hypothetical protein